MSALPPVGWEPVVESLAARLVEASLWGGALALAVWGLTALVPELPAAWRRWLWWGVALKLLLGLAPLPPLALPVLAPRAVSPLAVSPRAAATAGELSPALPAAAVRARGVDSARAPRPPRGAAGPAAARTAEAASPAPSAASRLLAALVAAWALGAAAALLVAAGEAWRALRLVRRAAPPADAGLRERFARLAAELGTPRARLLLSTEVETPQLTGILRPTVLLPARAAATLAGPELEMALAHELVHVRQHDLLLGLVPALAARIFFFHPLARLAAREHALAREAVCDAAVVGRYAPSPRDYGRLLLRLSLPNRAPLRAAVAAATHHTLQRRLEMLLHPPRRFRTTWAWLAGAAALAVLVPIRLTAAPSEAPSAGSGTAEPSARVAEGATLSEDGPAQPAAADGARRAAAAAAGDPERAPGVDLLAMAAQPSGAPTFRAAAARAEDEGAEAEDDVDAGESDDWEEDEAEEEDEADWEDEHPDRAFMVTHGDGHTISGSSRDHDRAARWRRGDEDLIWLRRGGHEWVIRDPALLAQAQALWEPQRALGAKQAELGERQAELGVKQADLGRLQADLGAKQAELGARQAEVHAKMAELGARQAALDAREYRADAAERRSLREQRGELEAERQPIQDAMEELGRLMAELGERQGELGDRQGELGQRQGELGDRQGELGRQQARAARVAERELWKLLDEAIAAGKAQQVD